MAMPYFSAVQPGTKFTLTKNPNQMYFIFAKYVLKDRAAVGCGE